MSGVLRDSTDPFAVPLEGLAAVAGYGDGTWVWSSAGWARFPATIVPLSIVVDPAHLGDVLDVETGDAAPADVPGWCARFRRPGRRAPTVYCNRETWPAVVRALGPAATSVDFWIATLDGNENAFYGAPGVPPPPGIRLVAVQARGQAQTGGHWDESVILDASWIGGEPMIDPTKLEDIWERQTATDAAQDDAGTPIDDHWAIGYALAHARAADHKADQVLAALAALQRPQVDAGAVAAALAADSALLEALAAAVARVLGARLSAG